MLFTLISQIENFTVSFGDGQALCALVHHYHPSLLPWGAVNTKTTLTYQDDLEKERCALDLNSSEVFSPAPFPGKNVVKGIYQVHVQNMIESNHRNFFPCWSSHEMAVLQIEFHDWGGVCVFKLSRS